MSINYRYLDDELAYLFENCDAEALVFHASLGERVMRVARALPGDQGCSSRSTTSAEPTLPPGVLDYEQIATTCEPAPRISRSPDDIVMWYSGGTTGLPKGVLIPIGRSVESARPGTGACARWGASGPTPRPSPTTSSSAPRQLWEQGAGPSRSRRRR